MPQPQLESRLRRRPGSVDYLTVSVTATDKALREFLKAHPNEPHSAEHRDGKVTVQLLIRESLLGELRRFGTVEILENSTQVGKLRQREVATRNLIALQLDAPPLAEQIRQRTLYMNVDEVESAIDLLAQAYPSLARVEALPHSTAGKRTCKYVAVGAVTGVSKDALVITGGVHAREWGSCEIALTLAADLLLSYSTGVDLAYGPATASQFTALQIKTLLDKIDIVIFPQVNPDGRSYSQTPGADSQWQKNRNPAHALKGDPESIGVDLNRNFDFLFNLNAFHPNAGVSATADPGEHDYYHGPSAFSEAETQNVRWLLDKFERCRWYVDVHSSGNQVLHVWSDDQMQTTDPTQRFTNSAYDGQRGMPNIPPDYREYIAAADLASVQTLAQSCVDAINGVGHSTYVRKPGFDFYNAPISGASHDYAYSRHIVNPAKGKILGFIVEWGDKPQPVWPDMQKVITDVTSGLVGFCLSAAAT